ncbi:MAG: SCO family protein [Gammaproteobacteria bacterium]|nr:SCO family protein [Gammaproteobacteria bacterium]
MNKFLKTLLILLIVVAATASGVWFSQWWHQRQTALPEDLEALVLPQARDIGAFTLTDHNGDAFTDAELEGKWSFLFFGYTNCPDVCPTTLAIMNSVAQSLEAQDGNLEKAQFIFVSVDPERDTPEQMRDYLGYFNKQFIGITGERAQLDQLARQMSVMYFLNKDEGGDQYTVDHSAAILLTQPDGNLRALFSTPHIPENIFESFYAIRNRY